MKKSIKIKVSAKAVSPRKQAKGGVSIVTADIRVLPPDAPKKKRQQAVEDLSTWVNEGGGGGEVKR